MGVAAFAQEPRIENARVVHRPAASGLEGVFRAARAETGAHWIGYAVTCRANNTLGQRVMLEGSGGSGDWNNGRDAGSSSDRLFILFRGENAQIGKIRIANGNAILDAGGLPLTWIDDVRGSESVRLLEGFLDDGRDGVRNEALVAIALHDDPESVTALLRAAHQNPSGHTRGQALFWLAQKASHKIAGEAIENAIENDPETAVKRQAVFALSQMPAEEGVPRLIAVAKTNRNREVRKQAVFWLGQSRDPRALQFFEEILSR